MPSGKAYFDLASGNFKPWLSRGVWSVEVAKNVHGVSRKIERLSG